MPKIGTPSMHEALKDLKVSTSLQQVSIRHSLNDLKYNGGKRK